MSASPSAMTSPFAQQLSAPSPGGAVSSPFAVPLTPSRVAMSSSPFASFGAPSSLQQNSSPLGGAASPFAQASPAAAASPFAQASPAAAASPFAQASPAAAASPFTQASPAAAASPFARAASSPLPNGVVSPFAQASPAAAASPFAQASPAAAASPFAQAASSPLPNGVVSPWNQSFTPSPSGSLMAPSVGSLLAGRASPSPTFSPSLPVRTSVAPPLPAASPRSLSDAELERALLETPFFQYLRSKSEVREMASVWIKSITDLANVAKQNGYFALLGNHSQLADHVLGDIRQRIAQYVVEESKFRKAKENLFLKYAVRKIRSSEQKFEDYARGYHPYFNRHSDPEWFEMIQLKAQLWEQRMQLYRSWGESLNKRSELVRVADHKNGIVALVTEGLKMELEHEKNLYLTMGKELEAKRNMLLYAESHNRT